MKNTSGFIYTIFAIASVMIGYTIHQSVFWAVKTSFLLLLHG